jgi:Uma2 family endonuclease
MSPSYGHAAIAAMLITEIHKERKFRAFSELTLVIGETEYVPDISVYPWRKIDYLKGDVVSKGIAFTGGGNPFSDAAGFRVI